MDLRLILPFKPLLFFPPKLHLPPRFSPHSHSVPLPVPRIRRTPPLSCSHNPTPEPLSRPGPGSEPDKSGSDLLDAPSIWGQVREIALFAGPATGLWICPPMMSLIDTMVIGQCSSLELAALGPATVLIDYLSYIFMFLAVATSNMVATSLAKKEKDLAQHLVSMLLFVAFACGWGMLLLTKLLGIQALTAFTGSKNVHLIPAANTYIQIRGFAWPAVLMGMVAQSASLGMKDSWGPLKALAIASAINGVGDVLFCLVWSYGIAGAAWATMFSQIVAAFMMLKSLNNTGFRAFQLSIPTLAELLEIFAIAAPVFMTTTSKVGLYSLLTYFATSMGTVTVAAHQVMINLFYMCTVWGEPLSQTAQSFMPELIYGVNRSLLKARMLLKSLVIIGAMSGLMLGIIGTSIPWFFPYLFTSDNLVAREMHTLVLPCFIALMATPPTNSLEGTLVASRDFRFFSLTMTGCFCFSWLLLLLLSSRSCSLSGCWWVLAIFQLARLLFAFLRLVSPRGLLFRDESHQQEFKRAKAT